MYTARRSDLAYYRYLTHSRAPVDHVCVQNKIPEFQHNKRCDQTPAALQAYSRTLISEHSIPETTREPCLEMSLPISIALYNRNVSISGTTYLAVEVVPVNEARLHTTAAVQADAAADACR